MAPLIPAGKLNRLITIQQKSTAQDASGQSLVAWTTVVLAWAQIAGYTGMRTIRETAPGIGAEVRRYSFRIRFYEGLDEDMRISYDGRFFDIHAVLMDYDNHAWTDLVVQDVNDGGG